MGTHESLPPRLGCEARGYRRHHRRFDHRTHGDLGQRLGVAANRRTRYSRSQAHGQRLLVSRSSVIAAFAPRGHDSTESAQRNRPGDRTTHQADPVVAGVLREVRAARLALPGSYEDRGAAATASPPRPTRPSATMWFKSPPRQGLPMPRGWISTRPSKRPTSPIRPMPR